MVNTSLSALLDQSKGIVWELLTLLIIHHIFPLEVCLALPDLGKRCEMEWKAQDHMMLPPINRLSRGISGLAYDQPENYRTMPGFQPCLQHLRGDLIGEQQTCVPEQQGVTYPARTSVRAPPWQIWSGTGFSTSGRGFSRSLFVYLDQAVCPWTF